jgi:hypothetical protein
LFVLCWFVEQLNCAVLFWFPEQVNCVLCESRERDREEVKVALSVESAPTLFFFFVLGFLHVIFRGRPLVDFRNYVSPFSGPTLFSLQSTSLLSLLLRVF